MNEKYLRKVDNLNDVLMYVTEGFFDRKKNSFENDLNEKRCQKTSLRRR